MTLQGIFALAFALGVGAQTPQPRFSFRGSGQMEEGDIKQALSLELTFGGERLVQFERELQDMYTSLPKNANGLVDHQAVRYALHRYFLQRHGWFIRGLEPGNASWAPQPRPDGTLPPAFVREWVPTFLQDSIERKGGSHGMELHDMATMAATLEDLVRREVDARLKMVYDVYDFPPERALSRDQGDDVLDTFLISFLLANNLTAKSKDHMVRKRKAFAKKYKGFDEVHKWWADMVAETLGNQSEVGFDAVSRVIHDLGEKYHTFNEIECKDLRVTLQQFESKRPGRVRLSMFYNMSRFTHWRFTENAEWLKNLGALDDSDPKNPSVIIANYVMARPNCLESSNLYAICCRNTCEDLMAHLEREIGHSRATPARISALVASLPSDTVQAPRSLSTTLLGRLDQIASHHGGDVPLHGRLLGQWMHHAFPRECPYPHEAGAINPQTADEWMRGSGQSSVATEEEMKNHIENDVCAINAEGNSDCGHEDMDLPWSPVEELLSTTHIGKAQGGFCRVCAFVGTIVVLATAVLMVVVALHKKTQVGAQIKAQFRLLNSKWLGVLAVLSLMFVAYNVNLLDGSVFALALGGSLVMYMTKLMSIRFKACMDCSACLPTHSKGF